MKRDRMRELREPSTIGQAAVLLGTTKQVVAQMVERLDLFTIEVRGKQLIPACELRRFIPRDNASKVTLAEAAKQLGVTQRFLRSLVATGLAEPLPMPGLVFSELEIDRLRRERPCFPDVRRAA